MSDFRLNRDLLECYVVRPWKLFKPSVSASMAAEVQRTASFLPGGGGSVGSPFLGLVDIQVSKGSSSLLSRSGCSGPLLSFCW